MIMGLTARIWPSSSAHLDKLSKQHAQRVMSEQRLVRLTKQNRSGEMYSPMLRNTRKQHYTSVFFGCRKIDRQQKKKEAETKEDRQDGTDVKILRMSTSIK